MWTYYSTHESLDQEHNLPHLPNTTHAIHSGRKSLMLFCNTTQRHWPGMLYSGLTNEIAQRFIREFQITIYMYIER